MNYIKLVISIHEDYQEALIAELEEMDFDGYQQFDDEMEAYMAQKNMGIGDRERIDQLLSVYPGNNFIQTEEVIEEKNWNRAWEKTIQPQIIGDFLVKSTWARKKAEEGQIVLEIDPKQSFGTGYHATTRLMLKQLTKMNVVGATVLDAGTGTGILAIAAAKSGAKKIVAFDNDTWSIENTKENVWLNEVSGLIEVRKGSTDVVSPEETFDVILANINRNAILEMLSAFDKALKEGGILVLSGILKKDEKEVEQHLTELGLKLLEIRQEEGWLAVCASK